MYIEKQVDHRNPVERQFLELIFYLIINELSLKKKTEISYEILLHVSNNRPPVSIKTAFGGSR